MQTPLRILLLEDNPLDAELIEETLRDEGIDCDIRCVDARDEFLQALDAETFQLICADYSLPAFDGMSALALARERHPELPFILVSGRMGEEFAIEALKGGATDYVLKNNLTRLAPSVRRVLRESEEQARRWKAEAALRESRRRLEAVFNQTFEYVGILDPAGTLLEANQTALDFRGLRAEEVVGRPYWETPWWDISEEQRRQLREAIAEAARGRFIRYETQYRDRDGRINEIDFSLKPVLDERGEVVLLIPEGRNITDRKQAEEALRRAHAELEQRVRERTAELLTANEVLRIEVVSRREAEEKLAEQAALLNQTLEAIVACDLEGRILFWNQGAERIYGWSAEEVYNRNIDNELYRGRSGPAARARSGSASSCPSAAPISPMAAPCPRAPTASRCASRRITSS